MFPSWGCYSFRVFKRRLYQAYWLPETLPAFSSLPGGSASAGTGISFETPAILSWNFAPLQGFSLTRSALGINPQRFLS
jgi:hypothetical protein